MSDNKIEHLAIIMDGNGRWALSNNLTIAEGHKKGAENIKEILDCVLSLNIPYLTLFSFSAENWQRSSDEINAITELMSYYLKEKIDLLIRQEIRLKFIGRINLLNKNLQNQINEVIETTKKNNKMTLCIAFGYGGKQEIVDACQKIIEAGIKNIDENILKNFLYDPEMPEVDLLIRTGNACRVSNFLLWQSAYAELYFSNKYWPDFSKKDLIEAINDYAKRKRTFGTRN